MDHLVVARSRSVHIQSCISPLYTDISMIERRALFRFPSDRWDTYDYRCLRLNSVFNVFASCFLPKVFSWAVGNGALCGVSIVSVVISWVGA
ncbi:Uncharacterized protein APZ42_020623 [Daphnia magna]|uniref:Uncharacterized protein n=1 Tax=Daphnia magna TaxID=35525 RepID=A0A162CC45_9CRUS|nr:Uncharacterized protein APZ42_020623 [Daphnia magna]